MNVKPIIFSASMVRALLDVQKTQTRRILRPQPDELYEGQIPTQLRVSIDDVLWVRENWSGEHAFKKITPAHRQTIDLGEGHFAFKESVWYWADGAPEDGDWEPPRPSIHMPRWASRLTLVVTDVRVERVQDITEADALAEGVWTKAAAIESGDVGRSIGGGRLNHRGAFIALWEDIHGPGSWADNPWVAAYTFTVHRQNVDAYLATSAAA